MQSVDSHDVTETKNTFVEGVDFYYEGDLMVVTRAFLLRRGYCCENGCRHCPFKENDWVTLK